MSEQSDPAAQKDTLVQAALMHVVFDGWSDTTLEAAAQDCGIEVDAARALFPRGGVDLALAFHAWGDAQLRAKLAAEDISEMRIREKVTYAVRARLELIAPHKEAVRRGTTLFALPVYAPEGARAIWQTADTIWTALGDPSDDLNWYTKRSILAGVYSATVLYWLGDNSAEDEATWEFLDRRIGNVMQFEKIKARVNDNPFLKPLLTVPNFFAQRVRAPSRGPNSDLPGYWDENAQGGSAS